MIRKQGMMKRMLMEKVEVELPSALVSWYRMVSEHRRQGLRKILEAALINEMKVDLDDPRYVAEVVASRILVDAGIIELLLENDSVPVWLPKRYRE